MPRLCASEFSKQNVNSNQHDLPDDEAPSNYFRQFNVHAHYLYARQVLLGATLIGTRTTCEGLPHYCSPLCNFRLVL